MVFLEVLKDFQQWTCHEDNFMKYIKESQVSIETCYLGGKVNLTANMDFSAF